jgi:hypothetical protein
MALAEHSARWIAALRSMRTPSSPAMARALVVLLTAGCRRSPLANAPPGPAVSTTTASPTTEPVFRDLGEGTYTVWMSARSGSHKGQSTGGGLELTAFKPTPRPKRPKAPEGYQGLVDFQEMRLEIVAWGWTDADLRAVGAPMCDKDSPPSNSMNPERPGVVVRPAAGDGHFPSLLLGTVTNERTGSLAFDGCGIRMSIDNWNGRCFSGQWDRYGIAVDGSGTFSLCPTGEVTAPRRKPEHS